MADVLLPLTGGGDDIYEETIRDNLNRRTLIFNDEVNDAVVENYILHVLKWNREDKEKCIPVDKRQKIWIFLNSPGGEKLAGLMMLDVIKNSETPINCLILSLAASMASYIPMVCKTTYAFSHSVICMHDGYTGVEMSTRKASDVMAFFRSCDKKLDDIVLNNTNITEDFLNEIADREYYIFANEAKELGIVDYIIGEDCTLDDIL